MTAADILAALELPAEAHINQRVPKKLLAEQGAPTPVDKCLIQDGIDEIVWVAALKPGNVAIPAFRDAEHEYVEIAVLTAALRPLARPFRLAELIHRAIPYPVFLVTEQKGILRLSLAHKRGSKAEGGSQAGTVVVEEVRQVALGLPSAVQNAFLQAWL